jgi:nucleoside 2-deoxyribosyltransferase
MVLFSLFPSELSSETFQPLHPPLTLDIDAFPKVYLAGPFFNSSQRWLIRSARDALREQSVEVFSPYHDVGYGSAADVVPADIEAIRACTVLFALFDGLDSGTVFETGYARALEKPVIGYSQSESSENLKMMEGTDCEIYSDFVSAIHRAVWAAYDNR